MASEPSATDPVGRLAEEFVTRYRRGERPALSEYLERCPEQAERLRQLLPMLVMMEQAGPDATADELQGDTDSKGGVPERIGEYRILGLVGTGGMGVVYEAEHATLGRRALKVMRPEYAADPRGRERFLREVRAAARLHHSNIVTVYEFGEDAGRLFFTMQFIQGQPLDRILDELRACGALSGGASQRHEPPTGQAEAPRSEVARSLLTGAFIPSGGVAELGPRAVPSETSSVVLPGQTAATTAETSPWHYQRSVARVGLQAAEALDCAHREGIVHRDVKPSNLLLDTEGRVWVTDFGLAKAEGEDITHTGEMGGGTLRYMAPERLRGWADPRSDVYSLGLTLYEMLLLRPAFPELDRVKLMAQIAHEDPPRLRRCRPDIPRDLATIVETAIDKEPGRRYQSAGELAGDLRRFLEDRPLPRRRPGVAEQCWRWCRRNPAVASLTGGLLTVLATGLLAVTLLWLAAERAREQTAEHLVDARLKEAEVLAIARLSGYGPRLEAILNELLKMPAARRHIDRLRRLAVAPMGDPSAQEPLFILEDFPERIRSVSLDAKGTLLAVGMEDGSVRVHRATTGEPLASLPPPSLGRLRRPDVFPPVQTAFWSSDAGPRLVLVYQNGEVWLWEESHPDGREKTRFGNVFDDVALDLVRAISVAPDGRLAVLSWARPRQRQVSVHDLAGGQITDGVKFGDLGEDGGNRYTVALHPTGQRLAIGRENGVELVDLTGEEPKAELLRTLLPVKDVSYSSDGRYLGMTIHNRVQVMEAEPPFDLVARQPGDVIRGVGFRPGFHTLAFTSNQRNLIRLWNVRQDRVEGALLHPGKPGLLAFSADGNVLATASDTSVRLWRLAPLPGRREFASHEGDATGITYSPDGEWAATVGHARTLHLVHRPTGERTTLEGALGQCVAFSPDSRWLAVGDQGNKRVGFWKWNGTTWERAAHSDLPLPERRARPNTIWAVGFHPQGEYFAAGGYGGLLLWRARTNAEGPSPLSGPPTLVTEGYVSHFLFSPDGKWLVYRGRPDRPGQLHVHDLSRPPAEQIDGDFIPGRVYGNGIGGLAMTPDSRLVFLNEEREVEVWDLERRERVISFPTLLTRAEREEASESEAHLCMNPDPRRPWLAVNDPAAQAVELWDIETGQRLLRFPRREGTVWWVAWSPDGDELAFTRSDGTVEAWNIPEVRQRLARFALDW